MQRCVYVWHAQATPHNCFLYYYNVAGSHCFGNANFNTKISFFSSNSFKKWKIVMEES